MLLFCSSILSFTLKIARLFSPHYIKHETCHFSLFTGGSIVVGRVDGVHVFVGGFFCCTYFTAK